MASETRQLLVVTGMSGSGKTVTAYSLEDLGYFVVDSLPPTLLGSLWDLVNASGDSNRVVVLIDSRVRSFYKDLEDEINSLEGNGNTQATILFLDASDGVLIARYKETWRLSPLARSGHLLGDIQEERAILPPIKNVSNIIVDTSSLPLKGLKAKLTGLFSEHGHKPFTVEVMSFGFKYGMLIDTDIVMDIRFLPNPFYIPNLKPFTGLDKRVLDYVMDKDVTKVFYKKLLGLIETTIPGCIKEGEGRLTIAIGCTGRQHRSVSIIQQSARDLSKKYPVDISHREMSRYTRKQVEHLAYAESRIIRVIKGCRPKVVIIDGGTGLPYLLCVSPSPRDS